MFFPRIAELRMDRDMTQQQVANALGCNREQYRRYEKGNNNLPIWALVKLADLYGVSTDYILGREK